MMYLAEVPSPGRGSAFPYSPYDGLPRQIWSLKVNRCERTTRGPQLVPWALPQGYQESNHFKLRITPEIVNGFGRTFPSWTSNKVIRFLTCFDPRQNPWTLAINYAASRPNAVVTTHDYTSIRRPFDCLSKVIKVRR